jgi:hypothetical protein
MARADPAPVSDRATLTATDARNVVLPAEKTDTRTLLSPSRRDSAVVMTDGSS